ncbi:uncharacterized protein L969DRAFT_93079 [Mixia osmundae IAM 14324]|uniref:Uncharacterized protein n=1 Tax=Mixia osmundae (strain CBS 9802 / IAM 14324 / JCM 22182 / KY 12970) TaxID=764103 RepID=G7E661_MIXOS|nr:uncharacterized protein L969DRAFT_93079 [Mixia osmundae IAM 14324]KEI40525.1 hypothetical protein L969DRAFT_93079 [Mixia osmundae IAM 14324]GAA98321.1 hypothetical protein E5Q_05006 [Mixia osmundae IAM 14324]
MFIFVLLFVGLVLAVKPRNIISYAYVIDSGSAVCQYRSGLKDTILTFQVGVLDAKATIYLDNYHVNMAIREPTYVQQITHAATLDLRTDPSSIMLCFRLTLPVVPEDRNMLETSCCEYNWIIDFEASLRLAAKDLRVIKQKLDHKCNKLSPAFCGALQQMRCQAERGSMKRTLVLESPIVKAKTIISVAAKTVTTIVSEPRYLQKNVDTHVKDFPISTDQASFVFDLTMPLNPDNLSELEKHCCEFSWLLSAEASLLATRRSLEMRMQKPIITCKKLSPTVCGGPASMKCDTQVAKLIWPAGRSSVAKAPRPDAKYKYFVFEVGSGSAVCQYTAAGKDEILTFETGLLHASAKCFIPSLNVVLKVYAPAYLTDKATVVADGLSDSTDAMLAKFKVILPIVPRERNALEQACCNYEWNIYMEASLLEPSKNLIVTQQELHHSCTKLNPSLCGAPQHMQCIAMKGKLAWPVPGPPRSSQ